MSLAADSYISGAATAQTTSATEITNHPMPATSPQAHQQQQHVTTNTTSGNETVTATLLKHYQCHPPPGRSGGDGSDQHRYYHLHVTNPQSAATKPESAIEEADEQPQDGFVHSVRPFLGTQDIDTVLFTPSNRPMLSQLPPCARLFPRLARLPLAPRVASPSGLQQQPDAVAPVAPQHQKATAGNAPAVDATGTEPKEEAAKTPSSEGEILFDPQMLAAAYNNKSSGALKPAAIDDDEDTGAAIAAAACLGLDDE